MSPEAIGAVIGGCIAVASFLIALIAFCVFLEVSAAE